ncbi:MAG: acetyltransferase [Microscillaceae bacterium]|nr:acetyltransferase [Microscillaceae bacterium]
MAESSLEPVIIFGAGGLGKAALEIFKTNKVVVYGFLDDNESLQGKEFDFVTVLGSTDNTEFLKLIGKQCDAFVALDENRPKKVLVEMLREKRKTVPVNAIHATATISSTVEMGYGNLINAGAILGAYVQLGGYCIVHAGAIIDHETKIGDYVQIGAGSIINAQVEIGEGAFIGSGVTIVAGVKIGAGARVGAGSVVIKDVDEDATVFGNPAQKYKA